MMAMLWAQQIMLGKKTYAQVPRLLKAKVKEILIDSGCEELVQEQPKAPCPPKGGGDNWR